MCIEYRFQGGSIKYGSIESDEFATTTMPWKFFEVMILKGVDQLNAKLIERIYEGGDRKELLDLMFKARRGEINADSFEPDTSILPPGIYPGQQLYYVHIETIGLGIFT